MSDQQAGLTRTRRAVLACRYRNSVELLGVPGSGASERDEKVLS
jgi:hypothetical protein